MDLREIGLGGVDWIRLSQDRDRWRVIVSAVMNLRVLAPWSELVYLSTAYEQIRALQTRVVTEQTVPAKAIRLELRGEAKYWYQYVSITSMQFKVIININTTDKSFENAAES
jgi:hypothetical protein